jgi:hypothetical protein
MRFYDGPAPGDERPIDGGSFNRDDIGHEAWNFRLAGDRLYGYFQPPTGKVNLERIDPSAAGVGEMSNVLVVMVARRSKGGQVIIGWYEDATVHRYSVPHSPGKPRGYGHFCTAKQEGGVLLPEYDRVFEVPRTVGLGQKNVCYKFDENGEPRNAEWMQQAIEFIVRCGAKKAPINPEVDVERKIAHFAEGALAQSKGQGFAQDAKGRHALEQRAMKAATRHFEGKGYSVEEVSARRPYDLLRKRKSQKLQVEVKGTTMDGGMIILTRNE